MKVILSGSTGYIGREVLTHCLSHPSITSLILLTRRHPGEELTKHPDHSKAKVVILPDFITAYDDDQQSSDLQNEIKTADAAIWCLGTSYGDENIDIEYPLAFIRAVKAARRQQGQSSATATTTTTSSSSTVKPFRYIQLSGAFTEPPPPKGEPERPLWFFVNGRRVRGRTEATVLAETTDNNDDNDLSGQQEPPFSVYVVKPGGVLPKTGVLSLTASYIFSESWRIRIDELAATMVDLAVTGDDKEEEQKGNNGRKRRIFSNIEVVRYGRRVLASGKSG